MNTPKKLRRFNYDRYAENFASNGKSDGPHAASFLNEEAALVFAQFITEFAHLEQTMIGVLSVLLGHDSTHETKYIWNSIKSPRGRIELLRNLLEKSQRNMKQPEEWDKAIDQFDRLNSKRNDYAHGLWFTDSKTKSLILARTKHDPHHIGFLAAEPFDPTEIEKALQELRKLNQSVGTATRSAMRELRQ